MTAAAQPRRVLRTESQYDAPPAELSVRLAGIILAVTFTFSVLAFGGVQPSVYAAMEAVVLVAAVFCFWRGWTPVPRFALVVLGVLVAVPLVQLIPLPASLAAAISPNRVEFAQRLFAAFGSAPSRLPLSLNPHATEVALLKLIAYLLVFLIGYRLAVKGQGKILLNTVLVVGLFEAGYGLVQYLADWQYIFAYKKIYYTSEATGTYINRNHFAGLLEMVLPFLLAGILFRSRRGNNATRLKARFVSAFSSAATFKIAARAMLFAVLVLALLFSRSRMGIAAAFIGMLLVAGLHFLRARQRSAVGMLVLLLLIPACYALWIGTDAVISRFEDFSKVGAMEQDRLPVWRDAWRCLRDFQRVGAGLGAFESVFPHYQTNRLDARYEHAHSDYLEFASEIGVPVALVVFGGLWVLVFLSARAAILLDGKERRALAAGCAGALAAILLHSVTDFNLQIPANALLFSWLSGTATGLLGHPGAKDLA